jgi:hypothetical protein
MEGGCGVVTDVSGKPNGPIFKGQAVWNPQIVPKLRQLTTNPRYLTSQKSEYLKAKVKCPVLNQTDAL